MSASLPASQTKDEVLAQLDDERDFTASIGSFLMLTRDGKLDAVEKVSIALDGVDSAIAPAGLNLSILSPLISQVQRSSLMLEVDCGPRPRVAVKMRMSAGPTNKVVPAIGTLSEILSRSLENETLPILAQAEFDSSLAARRDSMERGEFVGDIIELPLRSLELRDHLPAPLAQALRELVMMNASGDGPKLTRLKPALTTMRSSLRETVLCDYMAKCVWLNFDTAQLGNVASTSKGIEFVPFDTDEPDISAFLCALEKDAYGDFLLDFREFGCVIPTPKRTNPWLGPTVHITRADFRKEHELEEFYSLYAGFRELKRIGAPVLLYRGQNPLLEPTDIRFLKISDRSINLLQGRILEGNLLQEGVRDFTAQELVWPG